MIDVDVSFVNTSANNDNNNNNTTVYSVEILAHGRL